jgi:hypothetical protein
MKSDSDWRSGYTQRVSGPDDRTPQPAAAPAVVAPPEQAAAATPVQGAETQSAAKRPKAPPGYTLGKRWEDGTYLFCREFSRVGTRFKEKICLTQEEYDEVERRSQLMRESMQAFLHRHIMQILSPTAHIRDDGTGVQAGEETIRRHSARGFAPIGEP